MHLGTADFRNCISKQYSWKYARFAVILLRSIVYAKHQWRVFELHNILISTIIAENFIKYVFLLSMGIIKIKNATADYSWRLSYTNLQLCQKVELEFLIYTFSSSSFHYLYQCRTCLPTSFLCVEEITHSVPFWVCKNLRGLFWALSQAPRLTRARIGKLLLPDDIHCMLKGE